MNRLLDSFDHYGTLAHKGWTGGGSNIGAIGRRSTNGFDCGGTTLDRVIDAQSTWIIGMAVKLGSIASGVLWQWTDGGTNVCELYTVSDGALRVTKSNGATELGRSAAGVISSTSVFYFVEWKYVIHGSAGVTEIWVDGVRVLNLTGQNTLVGSGTMNHVYLNATGTGTKYDDLYINDGTGSTCNDVMGDCQVNYQGPTGEGADTGWANNGGDASKHLTLAENPRVGTKYLSSSTLNDVYTATFSAPVGTGPIKSIQTVLSALRNGAGSSTMAPLTRHSGTDTPGVTVTPANGADGYFLQQFDVNPGTSAAWLSSDVTTDEFGIKALSVGVELRVDQFGLEVLSVLPPTAVPRSQAVMVG